MKWMGIFIYSSIGDQHKFNILKYVMMKYPDNCSKILHKVPKESLTNAVLFRKYFILQKYQLNQRCPTVFFRSPQMWRIIPVIRHIIICTSIFTHFTHIIHNKIYKFMKKLLEAVLLAKNRMFQFFCQKVLKFLFFGKVPFATFNQSFATCGEWRMGWTTLF